MKEKLKQNGGITLIALVITIIVLLILAGVSIAMLTGENGILSQAQRAKEETEKAQKEEENILGDYESYINAAKGGNTIYTDNEGKIAVIPKGFYVVPGLNTINEGLVISNIEKDTQNKGNQFVWIPVEIPVSPSEEEGTNNKAMAIEKNGNYRGLLYNFDANGSEIKSGCTTTDSDYREPDIVSDLNYDTTHFLDAGYASLEEMKQGIQNEYNKMIESVKKYKGFYVGRYEMGLEGTTPVSKKAENGIITVDNSNSETNMWYGLYSKCKEYAKEEEDKSVVSSMMWGSQYDAMLNWFQKNGINVTTPADNINTIKNSSMTTGSEEKDIIKNIFDLYGCHYEWTLECNYTYFRVSRSGFYTDGYPVAGRGGYPPEGTEKYYSTRITLYLK